MPRKYCVPECSSNYRGTYYVTAFRFPTDEKQQTKWICTIPRKDFTPTKDAVVWIKHFKTEFIVTEDCVSRPTNPKLAEEAYPSIFPILPSYLSSEPPKKRRTPEDRHAELDVRDQQAFMDWEQNDTIDSFNTLRSGINAHFGHDPDLVVVSSDTHDKESSCVELALEGERLCKTGDFFRAVQFFQAAVHAGTDDIPTLGALYSQLGNAYYILEDFGKSLEYHRLDLNLMRASGDRLGEAKASGNIGNTLKAMGKFDEAMAFCRRHQDIARELGERGSEAKALYNLGNVCHARGKSLGLPALYDPGEYPPDCNKSFEEAAKYFEENIEILTELRDRPGLGRTFGNLGNTYYVLGNFTKAIRCHEERLLIAKEFGDVLSERRAYTNLGNAYMFLGEFLVAADYFNKALQIARQVRDRGLEAQSCYSLGNTYTLLRNFDKAIEYHIMHLRIAQELKDRLGEGRACWSLGNAFKSMGQLQKALLYAGLHMEISKEVGDDDGQVTGQSMLAELRTMLGTADETPVKRVSSCREKSEGRVDRDSSLLNKSRRSSMENLDLVDSGAAKSSDQAHHSSSVRLKAPKFSKTASLRSNDSKQKSSKKTVGQPASKSASSFDLDDSFLDLLSKFQSRRIDDQRCCSSVLELGSRSSSTLETESEGDKENDGFQANSPNADEFFDMVAGIQGSRMDDQRADIFPGLHNHQFLAEFTSRHHDDSLLDDQFFEMLIRCQGSRIEDQRSEMPISRSAPTVPDEDFINLILRFQSSRLDEQRSAMPEVSKRVASKKSSFRRKSDKSDKQTR